MFDLKFWTLVLVTSECLNKIPYGGNIGGRKHWRIDWFRAFGKRKFGELIDQPIDY